MFNFFRKNRLSDKEEYEISLTRAMAADGNVMSFYLDFIPDTKAGREEYIKHFGRVPERQEEVDTWLKFK